MQTSGTTGFGWRTKIVPAVAVATISQWSPYTVAATMPTTAPSQATPTTPPVSYVEPQLLDAKLDAVEARTETKFAQLLGELKVISNNVANLSTNLTAQMGEVKGELAAVKTATASVKWNILAAGLAVGGLMVGILAFGQQMMQIASGLVGLKP